MGQYHLVVNLDKKEFVHPHKLGCGLKLWEQLASHPGTGAALIILMACSNGRGGGDLVEEAGGGVIGRWAGDRVAIVGDYAEEGDLPAEFRADGIYSACCDEEPGPDGGGQYTDISELVCKVIERELNGKFQGDGWRDFVSNEKPPRKTKK